WPSRPASPGGTGAGRRGGCDRQWQRWTSKLPPDIGSTRVDSTNVERFDEAVKACRIPGVTDTRLPRAERRRNTEQRILAAARSSVAEHGFERTTIRAIAAAAQVDPALVMQYFGSKQALFKQAARIAPSETVAGGPEQLTELLLSTLGVKIVDLPETSLA